MGFSRQEYWSGVPSPSTGSKYGMWHLSAICRFNTCLENGIIQERWVRGLMKHNRRYLYPVRGFPGGSDSKESSRNVRDQSLILQSGRSPGEGNGYPLQYSWASLVVQLVKNMPAMGETWVQSLGRENPLERGKAAHSSILAWRIPWTEEPGGRPSRWSQGV